jgi:tricorn protease
LGLAASGPGVADGAVRFLHDPSLRGDQLAFVHGDEIWVAPVSGGLARRLTNDGAPKRAPRFSRAGDAIAYSADQPGGRDVFRISLKGGAPERLTWRAGDDDVEDWSADGATLLIASSRDHPFARKQLYKMPASGGEPSLLPLGKAFRGALSASGERVAFTPLEDQFETWRRYRGGGATQIWVTSLKDSQTQRLPTIGANDTAPTWTGPNRLHFLSDRAGRFGIYVFDLVTGTVGPELVSPDRDIDALTYDSGQFVFADAGWLYRWRPGEAADRINVRIPASDQPARRTQRDASTLIESVSLAADGGSLIVEAAGDLYLQRPGATPINISRTSGAAERQPALSPDGVQLAFVSDRSGEYEIWIGAPDRKLEARRLGGGAARYPSSLTWSPDGRRIAFIGHDLRVWWIDVATGEQHKTGGTVFGPGLLEWSGDSRMLVYLTRLASGYGQVRELDTTTGQDRALTAGGAHVSDFRLDPDGRRLVVVASLEAGPSVTNYDFSSALFTPLVRSMIYEIDLSAEDPAGTAKPRLDTAARYPTAGRMGGSRGGRVLHLGLDNTVWALQKAGVPSSFFDWYSLEPGASPSPGLALAKNGLEVPEVDLGGVAEHSATQGVLLMRKGSEVTAIRFGPDGKATTGRIEIGPLATDVALDAERMQIFREASRKIRDYFHDPALHGIDWTAVTDTYAKLVRDVRHRSDLDRVLRRYAGEFVNSHVEVQGPERDAAPGAAGALGAALAPAGDDVLVARILAGSPWDVVRSPLTDVGVQVGDRIVAIEGQSLAGRDHAALLVERAGKRTSLDIVPASGGPRRLVEVTPLKSDLALRLRDHVRTTSQYVERRSAGRIAYLHQPDTSEGGLSEFLRDFFPQTDRAALIIDERFNDGGADPDYQLDTLSRRRVHWYKPRDMAAFESPTSVIDGPKVMLINAEAGSGGDVLPYQFKLRGLGETVGTRTWGGVNGGFRGSAPARFVDGGLLRVPDLATFGPAGEFILENVGVRPDIEVEVLPADVAAGRDPQIDAAIDHLLNRLTTPEGPPTSFPSVDRSLRRPTSAPQP